MSAAARELVHLYDERVRLTGVMADDPSRENAIAVLEKGLELDAACEQFRHQHYPRRHRVIVGLRQVWVMSRTGRSAQLVFDGATP